MKNVPVSNESKGSSEEGVSPLDTEDIEYSQTLCLSIDQIVGQNLKTFRKLRRMTLEELGKALGISAQQIQKYEKGQNSISAGKLYELSQILRVPIKSFYQGLSPFSLYEETGEDFTIENEEKDKEEGCFQDLLSFYVQMTPQERRKAVQIIRAWMAPTEVQA